MTQYRIIRDVELTVFQCTHFNLNIIVVDEAGARPGCRRRRPADPAIRGRCQIDIGDVADRQPVIHM